MNLQRYNDWRPTGFDPAGMAPKGKEEWLVLPVIQTFDSGCAEESNFASALNMLGGESATVTVDRFDHWGAGWIEIIAVAPNTAAEDTARDILAQIENYPVLDEEDLSRRESEQADEDWDNWGAGEFVKALGLPADLNDKVAEIDNKLLYRLFLSLGGEVETGSETYFRMPPALDIDEDAAEEIGRLLEDVNRCRRQANIGKIEYPRLCNWEQQYSAAAALIREELSYLFNLPAKQADAFAATLIPVEQ